jgi:hypothetical protein
MKSHRWNYRWFFLAIAAKMVAGAALFTLLFMWIWNGLITNWTGLETITFLQSAGLLLLFKILTGFPRRRHYWYSPGWHFARIRAYQRPDNGDHPIS